MTTLKARDYIDDREMKKLQNMVGEWRFQHIMRVVECAKEIAKMVNGDVDKAEIAAFFHDFAKYANGELLWEKCDEYGLVVTHEMNLAPQIIHGYLSAIIARVDYGIEDEDILNAIRYHTTGRANMSLLEKIVFLADYVEPARKTKGLEAIREAIPIDIDRAVYLTLSNTIKYLESENVYIAKDSMAALEYYSTNKR